MININKVNVFIISIFIIIFVGYLYLEKKVTNNVENFQSQTSNGSIDKDIKNLVKNVIKVNSIDKDICKRRKENF